MQPRVVLGSERFVFDGAHRVAPLLGTAWNKCKLIEMVVIQPSDTKTLASAYKAVLHALEMASTLRADLQRVMLKYYSMHFYQSIRTVWASSC